MNRLRWLLIDYAWPAFDCEDCIGAGCGSINPCYCGHYEAVGPNGLQPNRTQRSVRRFVRWMGWWSV
jgi:hypothetical protein